MISFLDLLAALMIFGIGLEIVLRDKVKQILDQLESLAINQAEADKRLKDILDEVRSVRQVLEKLDRRPMM
jgi:polyhydroxyalkanoate synthesis regulator phasin